VEIRVLAAGRCLSGRVCRDFGRGWRRLEPGMGSTSHFPLPLPAKTAPLTKSILCQESLPLAISAPCALFESVGFFAQNVYGVLANLFTVGICMFQKAHIERGDCGRCGTTA
jgi:hypothetical protein